MCHANRLNVSVYVNIIIRCGLAIGEEGNIGQLVNKPCLTI